jgi:hypothetical protein
MTNNTITVQASIDGSGWATIYSGGSTACWTEDSLVIPLGWQSQMWGLYGIVVIINGSDLFWIDEMHLQNAWGNVLETWGVENAKGFCLSTDPADGASAYCSGGAAQPSRFFEF